MNDDSSSDSANTWRPGFSAEVERALAKWPNVPACHGWLSLDRRGRWRIADGPITHAGAIAFLHGHYANDGDGRWYVQNGPQRAYVDLELAPWILGVEPDGSLRTQSGDTVPLPQEFHLSEHGDVLCPTPRGLAAVSDRDLEAFTRLFATADGADLVERLATLRAGDTLEVRDRTGRPCRVSADTEARLLARYRIERRPRP